MTKSEEDCFSPQSCHKMFFFSFRFFPHSNMFTPNLCGARLSRHQDASNCICQGAKVLGEALITPITPTLVLSAALVPARVTAEIIKHVHRKRRGSRMRTGNIFKWRVLVLKKMWIPLSLEGIVNWWAAYPPVSCVWVLVHVCLWNNWVWCREQKCCFNSSLINCW